MLNVNILVANIVIKLFEKGENANAMSQICDKLKKYYY